VLPRLRFGFLSASKDSPQIVYVCEMCANFYTKTQARLRSSLQF
jgi:hypothetical protein